MKKVAYNPYLPGYEYVPDGEPRIFNDRVYIYGSHDRAGGTYYCMEDYVCWSASTQDLSTWQYEGVIYQKNQDPDNVDGKLHLYAPDVIQGPDGRYYLYYNIQSTLYISVAVSDSPAGPYAYYGTLKKPDGERYKIGAPYDPAVINDNGRIWLYYGFCPHFKIHRLNIPDTDGCMCVELEQDMITSKGEPTVIIPNKKQTDGTGYEDHGFFEAASIRKINDLYYLVYCSEKIHELCYATSQYPNKDFVYGGTLISNADIGYQNITKDNARNPYANIHGGMIEIFGRWFIFYHRHTHGTQFSRQGCAEPIMIHEDGSIPQVEMTSCGLNGGVMSAKGETLALYACNLYKGQGGRFIEFGPTNVPGPYIIEKHENKLEKERIPYITNIQKDSIIGFRYFLFDGDESKCILSLRGKASGQLSLFIQEDKKGKIATLDIGLDTDEWQDFIFEIPSISGKYPLNIHYMGNGIMELLSIRIQ